jgi:hypothetical protein
LKKCSFANHCQPRILSRVALQDLGAAGFGPAVTPFA